MEIVNHKSLDLHFLPRLEVGRPVGQRGAGEIARVLLVAYRFLDLVL